MRLLIAASGTGGHLFPAIAVAAQLNEFEIEWLGVPDRLEQTLVPEAYLLHTITVAGFQEGLSLKSLFTLQRLIRSVLKVYRLLKQRNIEAVFTTGGYIAAPAIIAARLQGIPVVLHEANAIPGKVTRLLAPFCTRLAIGFRKTEKYFGKKRTTWVSTPVRDSFRSPQPLDLPIPAEVPLIVVAGGSQGAVAINQLVRASAFLWLETGAYLVHLTGNQDPDVNTFTHPRYIEMPFYDNMAGLLQRANLAISRAGAGTLTELAITHTPAILIPYPYAAEDHQAINASAFVEAGAALMYRQQDLTPELLTQAVLDLLNSPQRRETMAKKAGTLAVEDSAERVADLIRQVVGY
jgi:UDP-N-acetylglucosamine--N-acetylmuramyl-(pentapeptide) pyrophosphoryl-undecaprenol N-acetylglucosamine transferase